MAAAATESITIVVPEDLREYFVTKTVNGSGGFQRVARMLADRLADATTLHLTTEELRRIVHYSRAYGDGGFQSQLRRLIVEYVHQHLED